MYIACGHMTTGNIALFYMNSKDVFARFQLKA